MIFAKLLHLHWTKTTLKVLRDRIEKMEYYWNSHISLLNTVSLEWTKDMGSLSSQGKSIIPSPNVIFLFTTLLTSLSLPANFSSLSTEFLYSWTVVSEARLRKCWMNIRWFIKTKYILSTNVKTKEFAKLKIHSWIQTK